jgi:G3E family GTPase
MDRGCVCCSLRHDIVKALSELQARGKSRGVAYDNILLETTGLADPAPVAFTFFSNTWISSNFRLDSILCLVDAQHINRHLQDGATTGGDVNEAVSQIAFADIILLNKIDLVTPEELVKARELVRSINVTADLIEVQLAAPVPMHQPGTAVEGGAGAPPAAQADRPGAPTWDQLMGINSFSIERAKEVDPDFMASEGDEEEDDSTAPAPGKKRRVSTEAGAEEHAQLATNGTEATASEDARAAADNNAAADSEGRDPPAGTTPCHRQPRRRRKKLHDLSGVGSVGITARGPLDKYRFNAFMRDLLAERARDIFRCKGVLCIKGQERTKFVFQGVHETICFGPAASDWSEAKVPLNQIVFIGRNLPRKDLVEGFRSCVWVPLPDGWTEHFDPRTGQPYYVNSATGDKRWDRPNAACALVKATHDSHAQPDEMQPRRTSSEVGCEDVPIKQPTA